MKTLFSPFVSAGYGRSALFDNFNRIARILYRRRAYAKMVLHAAGRRVPLLNFIRTQFPFLLPDAGVPPQITVEFTNLCNLKCVYCTNPLGLRPRGFMSVETFTRLVQSIKDCGVDRVRVIGNGEPTLHPEFARFVSELAKATRYVSVLTNGQWRSDEVVYAMLNAPVDLIETSVDGMSEEDYEKSRIGGHFNTLLENLRQLQEARRELRGSCLINIRLMLRPSQRAVETQLTAYWRQYADAVMPQYVLKRLQLGYDEDVYTGLHLAAQSYPKCSLPFKDLGVNWNGDVPLCAGSAAQIGPPGLILGTINDHSLRELWNTQIMRQYRAGHRDRQLEKIPMCKGCAVGC